MTEEEYQENLRKLQDEESWLTELHGLNGTNAPKRLQRMAVELHAAKQRSIANRHSIRELAARPPVVTGDWVCNVGMRLTAAERALATQGPNVESAHENLQALDRAYSDVAVRLKALENRPSARLARRTSSAIGRIAAFRLRPALEKLARAVGDLA